MAGLVTRQATNVAERLRTNGLSGRTITLKVRLHDFTTLSRSTTLAAPTDAAPTIAKLARGLLGELDTTGGVRLLGVGVSGLADWIQEDLFGDEEERAGGRAGRGAPRGPADPHLVARDGRRARRPRARLGLGRRPGHRHRPLRDRGDSARPGPVAPGRRPGAQPLAARREAARPPPAAAARTATGPARPPPRPPDSHRSSGGRRGTPRGARPVAPARRRAPSPRSAARRRLAIGRGSPTSRSPTRSESGDTVYGVRHSRPSASPATRSARGPGCKRSGPGEGGRGVSTGTGGRVGSPTGRTSPTRTGGGPTRPSVSVEREPSTGSTAIPPATAT